MSNPGDHHGFSSAELRTIDGYWRDKRCVCGQQLREYALFGGCCAETITASMAERLLLIYQPGTGHSGKPYRVRPELVGFGYLKEKCQCGHSFGFHTIKTNANPCGMCECHAFSAPLRAASSPAPLVVHGFGSWESYEVDWTLYFHPNIEIKEGLGAVCLQVNEQKPEIAVIGYAYNGKTYRVEAPQKQAPEFEELFTFLCHLGSTEHSLSTPAQRRLTELIHKCKKVLKPETEDEE